MNVLLVEDNERIAAFLAKGLRQGGHPVEVVGAGRVAVDALLDPNRHCDLLVLDLGLPDMDGLDVVHQVRRHGNQVPVIVVTARSGADDRARASAVGVADYFVKPFPLRDLLVSVATYGRPSAGLDQSLVREAGRGVVHCTAQLMLRSLKVWGCCTSR